MVDSEGNKVRKSRKKVAIKPYTLLWFLELLFYGFYQSAVVRTKFLAYIDPVGWLSWLFPSLKARHAAWYQRKFGITLEEFKIKYFHDPVSGINNWYASWAVSAVLYALFTSVWNLGCLAVGISLGSYLRYFILHIAIPFILTELVTGYLEWNKRHLPYFKEFDKLSGFRRYWLGWLCTLLLVASWALCILTLGLLL